MSALSLTHAQQQFTAHLSAVEDAAWYAFRRRCAGRTARRRWPRPAPPPGAAWAGLLRRGKDPVEVGVHAIANNAIAYVTSGRKLGNPTSGRGAMDVFRRPAGPRLRASVSSPSSSSSGLAVGSWQDWLVADHRFAPADEAAFRVDFAAWLGGLPEKKRRVAELLAEGHEGVVVARLVGIAPARVSQLRTGAGGQLGGVPGRGDAGSDRTRLIDRQQRTRSDAMGPSPARGIV